jgi:hypothetical protein
MSLATKNQNQLRQAVGQQIYNTVIPGLGNLAPELIVQVGRDIAKWITENWDSIQNWIITSGNRLVSIGQNVYDKVKKWIREILNNV